jgi:hypothetical protein
MRRKCWNLVAFALVVAVPGAAAAQSTGTPIYQAPYRAFAKSEIGISLSDPGDGYAIEGSARGALSQKIDLGFRLGFADRSSPASDALLLGSDVRIRVVDHTDAFPLDGSFTGGLGMQSGDGYTAFYLPIGFSMGRRVLLEDSAISLVPYVHPVLTPTFGDASEVEFSFAFGVDVRLNPRIDLRFSGAIGDRGGVGFSAAFLR